MEIPKIIHQTWIDKNVPTQFEKLAQTWIDRHKNWEYILWTDEMNRNFIKEYFPLFMEKYEGYSDNIQKVDAVRYFILYKLGGVFIDLDFECRKNIECLFGDANCIFGKEPPEHCKIHDKNIIISNALMASTPNAPFFKKLCEELENYNDCIWHPYNKILESTGPFMLTRVYEKFEHLDKIKIIDHNLLYPLTKIELYHLLVEKKITNNILNKINNAYAIHYYWGTWWKKNQLLPV